MNFLTILSNGENTVKAIGDTVEDLFTSDEERLKKQKDFANAMDGLA